MSGQAPAYPLRLSLLGSDRVKSERDLVSGETLFDGRGIEPPAARAGLTEPPYTDPYVRWCGRGEAAKPPPIPIRRIFARICARIYRLRIVYVLM
jgi:hypothetical protein